MASLGAFLMPVDNSMLFMAVPPLALALKADPGLVTWVPTASLVGMTAFFIPLGRLSDYWGRKRLYCLGLLGAAVAAVVGGLSSNAYQLVGVRLLQGISAAIIAANSWSMISEVFPSQERGKALGINTAAGFLGLAAGPVLGGWLITQFDTWRVIFFVLAPFYLMLALFTYVWLSWPAPKGQQRPGDLRGAISLAAGLMALMLALSFGRLSGWASPLTLAFFVASAAVLGLFAYLELKVAKEPMLDLRTFGRNSQFTLGNMATLFHYMSAHQGLTILIAFYVQWALKRSAAVAGVIMLAKFFTMALFSPLSGWLSDKIGPRWLCALGMAFVTGSLLLLANMGAEVSLASVFLRLSLLGVGVGLFASPNISSVMGSLSQDKLGVASGTLGTFRSLGGTLGLALVGNILAGGGANPQFAGKASTAFLALAMLAVLGIAVSAVRGKRLVAANKGSQP